MTRDDGGDGERLVTCTCNDGGFNNLNAFRAHFNCGVFTPQTCPCDLCDSAASLHVVQLLC